MSSTVAIAFASPALKVWPVANPGRLKQRNDGAERRHHETRSFAIIIGTYAMRFALFATALVAMISSAHAEVWATREGGCGEWQGRWEVEQDRSGVWIGTIDHYQVGGPCERTTGQAIQSEVRAIIAGDNLFAFRTSENGACSYVAKMQGENRARGIGICEGVPKRFGFVIRFRAAEDRRPMRDVPPDDDLLTQEQRRQPDRRFQFRGVEELFER
jgi:hypothetical protein